MSLNRPLNPRLNRPHQSRRAGSRRWGPAAAALALAAAPFGPVRAEGAGAETPERRQAVVDLAYVLGEAHAYHRACAGVDDDTWRGRMSRLIAVEAPDARFRQRLMSSFNAGFLAGGALEPVCGPASVEAERKVAVEGQRLSRRLAAPP